MKYAKDLGPRADKGVCFKQQMHLLYSRWVEIWATDLSVFHVPDIHCDPGWGQTFSHSSLDLVEVFKDGPTFIVG